MSTDSEWEKWGKKDPYFGVLADDRFRTQNLTEATKFEFFESGKRHVQHVLKVCRRNFDPEFAPKRVLDFGCGTGRHLIALARTASHVVGLDVSDSMLNEARKNCDEYAAQNVSLLKSDDDLSCVDGHFDFIHSVIVFQHIPVERGRYIFTNLLRHLNEDGICAVHFTYSKAHFGQNFGLAPRGSPLKKTLKIFHGLFKKWQTGDPEMQMNPYNLNELFFSVQSSGAHKIHAEFSDHGGELGLLLYFQKSRAPSP